MTADFMLDFHISVSNMVFHNFTILEFQKLWVSVGGVLGKNSTHKTVARFNVIKMWCKPIGVFEARFSNFWAYLANRLS